MNIETIRKFCGENDSRDFIRKPIIFGDDILCTNGQITIVFSNSCLKGEIECKESIIGTIEKLKSNEYEEGIFIEPVEKAKCNYCSETGKIKCKECDGSGIIEFYNEFNEYEVDCKSCDDENNECPKCSGTRFQNTSITYKKRSVNNEYIELCNDNLSNPKFCFDEKFNSIRIEHDHGYGFLKSIHEPFERNFIISSNGEIKLEPKL